MAQYENYKVVSLLAGGPMTSNTFVESDSSGEFQVTRANADTDRPLGVALKDGATTADNPVPVAIAGIVPIVAGAAVSIGDQVAPDADGKARTAASGDSMCGLALTAASGADELISVLLGYQGQALE